MVRKRTFGGESSLPRQGDNEFICMQRRSRMAKINSTEAIDNRLFPTVHENDNDLNQSIKSKVSKQASTSQKFVGERD